VHPESIHSASLFPHFGKKKITCTKVFTAFAMTLRMELRHILFPLIILEMSLQLDWSPPVVNSVGHDLERHTPNYILSGPAVNTACQSTNQAMKSKEWALCTAVHDVFPSADILNGYTKETLVKRQNIHPSFCLRFFVYYIKST